MILVIILLLYVVPFVFNYVLIRDMDIKDNVTPCIEEVLSVILPIVNLIIMFNLIRDRLDTDSIARKFFMIKK